MRLDRIFRYFKDEDYRFAINANLGFFDRMDDREYLEKRYFHTNGEYLNLDNPQSFNEKMNWLKIHDRKSIYTTMVDKYAVKKYVSDLIGSKYVIPTIKMWEDVKRINLNELPEKFVLKTNHGCGGMFICRGERYDSKKVKKDLLKALKKNYYYHMREWPYKNVKPLVFAEEYMQNGNSRVLQVYKVFNFNGVPRIIQTITNDKTKEETIDYFDTEWNLLDLKQNFPNSKTPPKKPETLKKMLELSAKCSKDIPFLRTDWYEINGKLFFSEFTFYSDAGLAQFHPKEWDLILGNWLELPSNN